MLKDTFIVPVMNIWCGYALAYRVYTNLQACAYAPEVQPPCACCLRSKKQGRRAPATLRWLLRRTLRRALGTEESVRRFLAQHWTEWAMLPDIEQLGGLGGEHNQRVQDFLASQLRTCC